MKQKIRVGLVCGGQSAEHEVSLQSAKNILEALNKDRFEAVLIGIDKQGRWHVGQTGDFLLHADDPAQIALSPSTTELALVPGRPEQQLADMHQPTAAALRQIDVVFPIVHGSLGEDGALQGLLRFAKLPFVGSDVLGSAVCMDKDVAKRLLRDAGLDVAPFVSFTRSTANQADFDALSTKLGLPMFVKPANQGSSVGVSKVRNRAEFAQALALALRFDHKVLVEQCIAGREIECAVLGNDDDLQASVCGEIVVHDDFYAYATKYLNADGATVVVPADLPAATHEQIRQLALQAFRVLGCAGLARVDVFLTPQGRVVINEVNTLPGFTSISMYPKLWQASGMSYSALLTRLIELALERHVQQTC